MAAVSLILLPSLLAVSAHQSSPDEGSSKSSLAYLDYFTRPPFLHDPWFFGPMPLFFYRSSSRPTRFLLGFFVTPSLPM